MIRVKGVSRWTVSIFSNIFLVDSVRLIEEGANVAYYGSQASGVGFRQPDIFRIAEFSFVSVVLLWALCCQTGQQHSATEKQRARQIDSHEARMCNKSLLGEFSLEQKILSIEKGWLQQSNTSIHLFIHTRFYLDVKGRQLDTKKLSRIEQCPGPSSRCDHTS